MRRGARYLAPGVIFAAALAFWQRRVVDTVPLPQQIDQWNSDLYTIYYPVFSYLYRSGELLPRWNPYQLAGMPALASWNGGPLYPPNLLAALMPVNDALGWLSAFHLGLAGCFAFACARALALSTAAAAIAAVLYMLNGLLVGSFIHPSYLAGHAYIPAVLLCAGRIFHRPTVAGALWLGAAIALQLLTGHPQIVCYTAYAALAGGLVYLALRRPVGGRHLAGVAGCLVLGAGVAVLLAAAQLMPALELVAHAARGRLTLEGTAPWEPTAANTMLVLASSGPALVLVLAALADSRRRLFVVPAFVVALLAALIGLGTPLYGRGFFNLPGVDRFRVVNRMTLVAAAAASVVAAVGLDVLRAAARGAARPRLLAAGGMLLAALAWTFLLHPGPVGMLVLAAIVCLPLIRGRRAGALLAAAVVGLVAADRFVQPGNRVMIPQNNAQSFFAPPPFVSVVREGGGEERTLIVKDLEQRFLTMEKSGSLYRYPVVQDQDPLLPREYERFLSTFDLTQIDATMFGGRFMPPITEAGWRSLDMLATRWIVAQAGRAWPVRTARRLRLVADAGTMQVWENVASLPRAYLVGAHEVVPDAEEALARVQRRDFEPRSLVIVDREIDWPAATGEPPPAAEAIAWERSSAEEIRLRVRAPRPAVLVLADLDWPGWRVAVDGEERPILRADYLFRAVAVAPGEHTVIFHYASRSIQLGMLVSLATLLALTVVAWRGRPERGGPTPACPGGTPGTAPSRSSR